MHESIASRRAIAVTLGGQPIHGPVSPILLSLEHDFYPHASLLPHVLSMFLLLLGRILVYTASAPLFPP